MTAPRSPRAGGMDAHRLLGEWLAHEPGDVADMVDRAARQGLTGGDLDVFARLVTRSWWTMVHLPMVVEAMGAPYGPWLAEVDDQAAIDVLRRGVITYGPDMTPAALADVHAVIAAWDAIRAAG